MHDCKFCGCKIVSGGVCVGGRFMHAACHEDWREIQFATARKMTDAAEREKKILQIINRT